MAYLNLDLDYFDHPKTKRLVGLLGRGSDVLPVRLWAYCGKYHADTGHLIGYSPTEIENAIGWWGQPGRALEALLQPFMEKPGFLERTESGFRIHDWEGTNGHISALKEKAKAGAKARWDKYRSAQAMLKHSLSNAPGNAPNKDGQVRTDGDRGEEGPGEEGGALWAAIVQEFRLLPASPAEREELQALTAILAAKGATPTDIPDRAARYRTAWPKMNLSPASLVRWWDRFAPPRPKALEASKSEAEADAHQQAEDRAWLALSPEEQDRQTREKLAEHWRLCSTGAKGNP